MGKRGACSFDTKRCKGSFTWNGMRNESLLYFIGIYSLLFMGCRCLIISMYQPISQNVYTIIWYRNQLLYHCFYVLYSDLILQHLRYFVPIFTDEDSTLFICSNISGHKYMDCRNTIQIFLLIF